MVEPPKGVKKQLLLGYYSFFLIETKLKVEKKRQDKGYFGMLGKLVFWSSLLLATMIVSAEQTNSCSTATICSSA